MDEFGYLSVLLSVILGLAVTQILKGFRGLILSRARGRADDTDHQGQQFWVWSQSARMRDALLYTPTTCALHFWNYRRRFIVNLNSHEVLCRSLRCAFSGLAQCLADA